MLEAGYFHFYKKQQLLSAGEIWNQRPELNQKWILSPEVNFGMLSVFIQHIQTMERIVYLFYLTW